MANSKLKFDTDNKRDISSTETHHREILIIAVALTATLLFIWLIPKSLSLFTGSSTPSTYAIPDTSCATEDSLPPVSSISDSAPEYWLQGRGASSGNAGWGDSNPFTPLDTIWILDDVGGREFFSAPAFSGGEVFFGCNDGYLRCLNAATGELMWLFGTPCGICGEPAVDSSLVYFGGQDGTLYALDRTTGREVWHKMLGYHIFCDVAIVSDTLLLTGNSNGMVYALDARSGSIVWKHQLDGIILGPVIADSLLIFTTENGTIAAFNSSGTIQWQHTHHAQPSAPSAFGTSVIAGYSDGVIRHFSLHTGEIIFETDITAQSVRCVISRPVIAGNYIIVGTCDSRLVCIALSSGELIWQQYFENWIQLPPVVGESCIYVSCDDRRLHILDAASGTKLDSLEMGGYSGTAPLLVDNVLYYGTTNGEFFALEGAKYISNMEDSLKTDEIQEPENDGMTLI